MSRATWTLTAIIAALLVCSWLGAAAAGYPAGLRSAHGEPAKTMPQTMVAVTNAGKLYHRPECKFIHGPVKLETGAQAFAEGYAPCPRCMK